MKLKLFLCFVEVQAILLVLFFAIFFILDFALIIFGFACVTMQNSVSIVGSFDTENKLFNYVKNFPSGSLRQNVEAIGKLMNGCNIFFLFFFLISFTVSYPILFKFVALGLIAFVLSLLILVILIFSVCQLGFSISLQVFLFFFYFFLFLFFVIFVLIYFILFYFLSLYHFFFSIICSSSLSQPLSFRWLTASVSCTCLAQYLVNLKILCFLCLRP
jgi:hypothetical protein